MDEIVVHVPPSFHLVREQPKPKVNEWVEYYIKYEVVSVPGAAVGYGVSGAECPPYGELVEIEDVQGGPLVYHIPRP